MFLNYRNQEMAFNRYIILIIVAVLSLAPFIYMLLVSFMTLGEATNIKILLDHKSDIFTSNLHNLSA